MIQQKTMNKNAILVFMAFLLSVNMLCVLLFFSNQRRTILQSNPFLNGANSNKININLDILDIYRLDISCNYITEQLSGKISTKFKNNNKKCSYSSLDEKIDENLERSLAKRDIHEPYKPFFSTIDFDPFKNLDNGNISSVKQFNSFKNLQPGGVWSPEFSDGKECNKDNIDNIVFIVPYSNSRIENLKIFLINMHNYLQTAAYPFRYRIIVPEQALDLQPRFNKGRLINTAFKYITEIDKSVDCVIIHDVDMIPSMDSSILETLGDYRCRQMPWHMSNKVFLHSSNSERVYNQFLTGGILSLRTDHVIAANGMSNQYFGWGGEDDDWTIRLFDSNMCIMRPKSEIEKPAAFLMLNHTTSWVNQQRFSVLAKTLQRKHVDGLLNIKELTKILSAKNLQTFTHLLVDVGN